MRASHIGRHYPCSFFLVHSFCTTYEQPGLLKRGVYTTVHSRIVAAEARLELASHRVKVCCLYHSTTRQYMVGRGGIEPPEVLSNHSCTKSERQRFSVPCFTTCMSSRMDGAHVNSIAGELGKPNRCFIYLTYGIEHLLPPIGFNLEVHI